VLPLESVNYLSPGLSEILQYCHRAVGIQNSLPVLFFQQSEMSRGAVIEGGHQKRIVCQFTGRYTGNKVVNISQ